MTTQNILTTSHSDIGRTRSINEDAYLAKPSHGIWAVADGMGGHFAGDVASQSVVSSLDNIEETSQPAALLTEVKQKLAEANTSLLHRAHAECVDVIATTVVVLLIKNDYFACVWSGDSRIYRYRGGLLERLSHDHSEVQRLIDDGLIGEEAAESHPASHIVTHAIGTDPELFLEMTQGETGPGDTFLLCSDGLNKELDDTAICRWLGDNQIKNHAEVLVNQAVAQGGRDNVTAVCVKLL